MMQRIERVCVVRSAGDIAPLIIDGFARAFRALGLQVFVLDFDLFSTDPARFQQHLVNLLLWEPELAVAYGFNGLLPTSRGPVFRTQGIPLALLHYDCPFFGLAFDDSWLPEFRAHPDWYYHFVWDRTFQQQLQALGLAHVDHLMLAADTSRLTPPAATPERDVAFVGRVHDPAPVQSERLRLLAPEANRLIEQLIEQKLAHLARPVLDCWADLWRSGATGIAPDLLNPEARSVYAAVHAEGSARVRRAVLEGITAATPDVFGAGWAGTAVRQHPAVDYEHALPLLYAGTRINLNVTSLQLEQAVNNRIFDVGAAGGFLLTDYRDDLRLIFPHYREISFGSIPELNEKIDYFLHHESERSELAHALQDAIQARHTYVHRACSILERVGGQRGTDTSTTTTSAV